MDSWDDNKNDVDDSFNIDKDHHFSCIKDGTPQPIAMHYPSSTCQASYNCDLNCISNKQWTLH